MNDPAVGMGTGGAVETHDLTVCGRNLYKEKSATRVAVGDLRL